MTNLTKGTGISLGRHSQDKGRLILGAMVSNSKAITDSGAIRTTYKQLLRRFSSLIYQRSQRSKLGNKMKTRRKEFLLSLKPPIFPSHRTYLL